MDLILKNTSVILFKNNQYVVSEKYFSQTSNYLLLYQQKSLIHT